MQSGAEGVGPIDAASLFKLRLEAIRGRPDWRQLPFHRRLRILRRARGWSHPQLARRMYAIGLTYPGGSASPEALVTMQSRWENDHQVADERNRRLLAMALQVTVADLGLTEDPDFFM